MRLSKHPMKITLQSDHMFLRKRDCHRSRGRSRLNEIIGIFYYAVLEAVRTISLTRPHKSSQGFLIQRKVLCLFYTLKPVLLII